MRLKELDKEAGRYYQNYINRIYSMATNIQIKAELSLYARKNNLTLEQLRDILTELILSK